jgi:hypothetical protein
VVAVTSSVALLQQEIEGSADAAWYQTATIVARTTNGNQTMSKLRCR